MGNDKDRIDTGGGIRNAIETVFSVLVYIVYVVGKKSIEIIRHPLKNKSTICIISFVVASIAFWPIAVTLLMCSSGVLLVLGFFLIF